LRSGPITGPERRYFLNAPPGLNAWLRALDSSETASIMPPEKGGEMGRQSREHREKRGRKAQELEEELRQLADGDAEFWTSKDLPLDTWKTNLEDILAFESVGSGTSLFDGLQEHGLDLPRPETLDERQSAKKVEEVMRALLELQVILIGFNDMSARELYTKLWNETLWEGCYVRKRIPGAVTMMDVSHSLSKSEMRDAMDRITRRGYIH